MFGCLVFLARACVVRGRLRMLFGCSLHHLRTMPHSGGVLSEFTQAYETWGSLNADRSNAVLLFTGLSASSHAKSHEVRAAGVVCRVSCVPGV